MSRYSYVALDDHGVEQRGALEAHDEREARNQLRSQRLRPVRLVPGDLPEDLSWAERWLALTEGLMPRAWMPVRAPDLAGLFRQLSLMLRSGHALAQALDIAQRLQVKHAARALVGELADALRGGRSLSQAMAARGRPFNVTTIQLTASAERAGELDTVFERLADDLERQADLKRQLLSTMMYPVIVLFMAIGVFVFLAVSVVPRFASFIEGRGRRVPPEAQFLLDLADGVARWGAWVALAMGLLLGLLLLAWWWTPTRRVLDRVVLLLPVIGGLVRDANMTQAAWTLGLLVRSGTTALEALRVARRVVGNDVYVAMFDEAEQRLLSGQSLARALEQRPMPPLFRHMVAVGEGTGQLELVLDSVAQHFRRSLEARIKLVTTLIEPALLTIVGGVVGFVYYTFFKTLMSAGGGG
ncbi:type II secretion system F family protein [Pseudaquabacterium rugosum]|uniref:Type II secretion system F family protein n=1 Tax=Pseudaquabacterium rugosum TaxID=2984194 RepID=A0ABU9BDR3_9BURK